MRSIDADLGIPGFAIPNAPVQALNLLDNHRLRLGLRRVVGWQRAGDLLQVLQPHGGVEPIQDGRPSDAGIGENAPQPRAAVGESRQRRVLGSPDSIKAAAD